MKHTCMLPLSALACALLQTAALAADAPRFLSAKPVWPAGREKEMNLFVGFRVTLDSRALPPHAKLRFTCSSIGRVFVNGTFAGYGPARGPHGFYRVEEIPVGGTAVRPGANTIAIEVAGYNVNSFYLLDQPSFFQAEVLNPDDGQVLAATGVRGFEASVLSSRIQKVQRFSFQRTFSEVYRLAPDSDAWRLGRGPFAPASLALQPEVALLPRLAPDPGFALWPVQRLVATGTVRENPGRAVFCGREINNVGPAFKGFPKAELATIPWFEVQRLENAAAVPAATGAGTAPGKIALADHSFAIAKWSQEVTGFLGATVTCSKPLRLYAVFDEILSGTNDVSSTRLGCCNVVTWDLTAPGTYALEAFEPNSLQYAKLIAVGGDCTLENLHVRDYSNPSVQGADFRSSDPDLDRIFKAAKTTFAQNAVDNFMDCPSRERGGWLCDSYFIGRVSALLTGNSTMERIFFQNYTLPSHFAFIPEGMLPMCYPSDHNDGCYIPNWAMWFVIELDEYLARSGDRATVDALKPRVLALLALLDKNLNADGLLENLPGWVFIEWSKANSLVNGVNYPSNMTYAAVLEAVARLYGLPEFAKRAEAMRATIRRQSYNGAFFMDNATRLPDGTLRPTGVCTEVCQYYAFFFRTAAPEAYPQLWKTLRDDFGPDRAATHRHPEIAPANAFVGNYLRLELLSRAGLSAQILRESKGYFLKMVDLTGTLWENDTPTASCCHGFASHTAVLLARDILGLRAIDPVGKTVRISIPADLPLESCSGSFPTPDGPVSLSWKKAANGKPERTLSLPSGWRSVQD